MMLPLFFFNIACIFRKYSADSAGLDDMCTVPNELSWKLIYHDSCARTPDQLTSSLLLYGLPLFLVCLNIVDKLGRLPARILLNI